MTLLRLEGVARSVQLPDFTTLEILRSIDLEVEVGDHVSIVGRSGSGKSTLLNLLGLLDAPTAGRLFFDEVPLEKLRGAARDRRRGRDIGFIFQQFNLLPGRTALENVATPLLYAHDGSFWRRERLATEMLQRVGLGNRLHSLPTQLSGGEQQRVAIARAIAKQPEILLCDEPTGALDSQTGILVLEAIERVNRELGTSTAIITHNTVVAGMADRVVQIADGAIARVERNSMRVAARDLSW